MIKHETDHAIDYYGADRNYAEGDSGFPSEADANAEAERRLRAEKEFSYAVVYRVRKTALHRVGLEAIYNEP